MILLEEHLTWVLKEYGKLVIRQILGHIERFSRRDRMTKQGSWLILTRSRQKLGGWLNVTEDGGANYGRRNRIDG